MDSEHTLVDLRQGRNEDVLVAADAPTLEVRLEAFVDSADSQY